MPLLKTQVAGSASASAGTGASYGKASGAARYATIGGPNGWHPPVLYMLALVIAEVVIVAWLSSHLLKG